MSFAELLEQPGVVEHAELRSTFGFFAYHGGPVERATSLIARRAAEIAGASFYSIEQNAERPLHLPSIRYDPSESETLSRVLDHIEVVVTVHGYGRELDKQWILLGGQNRELAAVVQQELSARLAEQFKVIADLDEIPRELRGVHEKNPVNLPVQRGVQVELPPSVRWNYEARDWGDAPGLEPTETIMAVIDALAAAANDFH